MTKGLHTVLLTQALALIAHPDSWMQKMHELNDKDGNPIKMCGDGAVFRAARSLGLPMDSPTEKQARLQLCEALGVPLSNSSIQKWNDAPGRTHDEVVALFHKAINASARASV